MEYYASELVYSDDNASAPAYGPTPLFTRIFDIVLQQKRVATVNLLAEVCACGYRLRVARSTCHAGVL